jgi:hypothetical protein
MRGIKEDHGGLAYNSFQFKMIEEPYCNNNDGGSLRQERSRKKPFLMFSSWTIAGSFLGPAVWGLVFGMAAIYSKGIAMRTGIHYAVNMTTSAFGTKGNQTAIWTITPTDTVTTTFYGIDLTIILLSITVFVIGLATMEIYLRRKTTANNASYVP